LSFLSQIFGAGPERETMLPLYNAVVALGRDPAWYVEGQVPDTLDGRFDMIASILALVLLRLEGEDSARAESVLLSELFIDDMDGNVRQIGIGDLVVGKHVGRMVSALGGRLGAFRTALAGDGGLREPVGRNIFHDAPPSEAAVAFVVGRLAALAQRLRETPVGPLLAGELPAP